jgi:hypothetical protein
VLIQIIIITNDQNYSYALLTDLAGMRRKFTVSEIAWSDSVVYDFEFALTRGNFQTPTIVMMDFGFEAYSCEAIADRIDAVRAVMAIECIVLMPPAEAAILRVLRERGLPIFEGAPVESISAEAIH